MTRFSARMAALLSAVMSSPNVDKFEQSWNPAPQFRGPTRSRRHRRDPIRGIGNKLAKQAMKGTVGTCHGRPVNKR